jgi:hypothetical protein
MSYENVYLPVVKPEIGCSLEREMMDVLQESDDINFVKDKLRRLDILNPTIARFIREFSKTTKDKIGAAYCGIIVYRLLESQAEANKMQQDEIDAERIE